MKHALLLCLILFIYLFSLGQADSILIKNNLDSISAKPSTQPITNKPTPTPPQTQPKKPELFNSGFIDFQNSGQMNASARVFKLYIGEPKKFILPLSVYSGVSGNNLNTGNPYSSKGSEQMILGLINPMSGIFNLSTDNTFRFNKKK